MDGIAKLIVLGLFIAVVAGMLAGKFRADENWREQAITVGVSEWYLDTNYSKQFRWKTNAVGRE